MFWPTSTGLGLPVLLVMLTSAWVLTVVMAVPELLPALGSMVAVAAVAVFVIVVPPAVLEATLTTTVKESISPLGTGDRAKTSVPVPPGITTSVRSQPTGKAAETNVVLAGTGSLTVTICALSGPALVKLMV